MWGRSQPSRLVKAAAKPSNQHWASAAMDPAERVKLFPRLIQACFGPHDLALRQGVALGLSVAVGLGDEGVLGADHRGHDDKALTGVFARQALGLGDGARQGVVDAGRQSAGWVPDVEADVAHRELRSWIQGSRPWAAQVAIHKARKPSAEA
jgi:hypothetical protein